MESVCHLLRMLVPCPNTGTFLTLNTTTTKNQNQELRTMKLPILSKKADGVKTGLAFPQRLRDAHNGTISLSPWAVYQSRHTPIPVECNKCGYEWSATPNNLLTHKTGCLKCSRNNSNLNQRKKGHPLYGTWTQMLHRCNNPKHKDFPNYGGRGISVCAAWELDFWQFVRDVGERPEGCTLDRIDNDGNYEPGNVRWATKLEQSLNRRFCLNAKGFRQTPNGNYEAAICVNGKTVYLGRFDCPLMAHLAYKDALAKKIAGEPVK